jgi:hypothetical protein
MTAEPRPELSALCALSWVVSAPSARRARMRAAKRSLRGASHGRRPICGEGSVGPGFRDGSRSLTGGGGTSDSTTTISTTPLRDLSLRESPASRDFLAPHRVTSAAPAALGTGQARREGSASDCGNSSRNEMLGAARTLTVTHGSVVGSRRSGPKMSGNSSS